MNYVMLLLRSVAGLIVNELRDHKRPLVGFWLHPTPTTYNLCGGCEDQDWELMVV